MPVGEATNFAYFDDRRHKQFSCSWVPCMIAVFISREEIIFLTPNYDFISAGRSENPGGGREWCSKAFCTRIFCLYSCYNLREGPPPSAQLVDGSAVCISLHKKSILVLLFSLECSRHPTTFLRLSFSFLSTPTTSCSVHVSIFF